MSHPHCMSAAARLVALVAVSLIGTLCLGVELGQAPLDIPQQVLVVHDGGVLVGSITRAGDRYVVTRAGSEIQVPAASVLTTCARLEDAYEHRRKQMNRPTVDAHLALAEWCLRHGLLPQAARELVDASGLEPLHPRLKLLERRLAEASKPRRQEHGAVVPAAHVEAAATEVSVANADPPLDEELPSGAVERFTRKVQPILVNNCTIAGCHHPGGRQQFQLDRALLHGLANRRTTMRNLAETLTLVDRDRPELSPLLTVPRRTHGGMSTAIFGPRQQAAFTHLEEWVALLADPPMPAQEADATGAVPEVILTERPKGLPGKRSNTDSTSDVSPAVFLEAETEQPKPRRLRYGAQLQPWAPKDPFDPEIFNRRQQQRRRAHVTDDQQAEAVIEDP